MKNLVVSVALFVFLIFPAVCLATDVGGIIDANTTWTTANSPYNVISTVEIAAAKTLTIEAGSVINGGNFRLDGKLNAAGTIDNRITFNGTSFYAENQTGPELELVFSDLNGGNVSNMPKLIMENCRVSNCQLAGQKEIFARSNKFIDTSYDGFKELSGTSGDIRKNAFYRYVTGFQSLSVLEYNLFYNSLLKCRVPTIVHYNTFVCDSCESSLDSFADAIFIAEGEGLHMDAKSNYWNTVNKETIDSMILDGNDTSDTTLTVQYEPFLTSPDPQTPVLFCGKLDLCTLTLHLPFIEIQPRLSGGAFSASMLLSNNRLSIQKVSDFTDVGEVAVFDLNTLVLHMPCVQVGGMLLWGDLKLEGNYFAIGAYGEK